jgi:hypothetical protein
VRSLIAFVLSGPWQASVVVFTLITAGLVPRPVFGLMTYLGGSVLTLIALYLGPRQALQVLITAVLAFAGTVMLMKQPLQTQWPVLWLLASLWLAASIIRWSRMLGSGLQVLGLAGLLLIAVIYLVLDDPAAHWKQFLLLNKSELAELMRRLGQVPAEAQLQSMINFIAPLMTGFQVMVMVLGAALALLLGRFWQAMVQHPGAFGQEFSSMQYSSLAGFVTLVLVLAAGLMKTAFLLNIATVLVVVYVFPGLAVIHGFARLGATGSGWLIATYLLLVFMPQMMVFMLAVLGLTDTWAGYRKRRQPDDQAGD